MTNRSGVWYFVRRVPDCYRNVDPRKLVRITTGVPVADDPRGTSAGPIIRRLSADTEAFWETTAAGRREEAYAVYEAARKTARRYGFSYQTAAQVAEGDLSELLARLRVLQTPETVSNPDIVRGVLGWVEKPVLMLSSLFEAYQDVQKASMVDMSVDQQKRWASAKRRAVDSLLDVIGDKNVAEISRDDALDFRERWQQRVMFEGIEIDTANKTFGHLARMLRVVNDSRRLGLDPVFVKLRIEGSNDRSRTAYDAGFLQSSLLTSGALSDLNAEARAVVCLIAETGLRLSEACNLTADTINLTAAVPHVIVRADGRRMKTQQSGREMPLVGVALVAMKAFPEGFARYRDKAASLSALVNKYLEHRGLRPHAGQSLYSLRHTFEDRLNAIETPEKVVATLMGHKWQRPRYGSGPSLVQKHEWLSRIAFTVPDGLFP